MSSPGLKPTVELRSAGPQPELVDAATTRALVLSPLEARLLGLWDGICSASHLTDVARAHGLVIEGRQAAVFLERLSRAGFLAAPPTIDSGLVPDAPGLERLEDRAPKLRGDLLIEKPAGAKGVLRVTDPLKSRSFTLYDFEISIARLLDGRRTAGDVIDAANRLGIPVNLESLRKFVRQLRGYRFIDERAVAPSEPAEVTPSLDTWTPEQREMYESALRFWKQEKLAEAIEYLSALLEVNPNLQEPAELKARLEAERAGEANVDLNFDSLHGVVNPLAAADAAPAAMTVPDFVAVSPSPPAARPSKPSGRSPAVPAPEATVTDVLALHASPAPPAKPSRPSERVPAVPGELPSPKPSRPTGELPAVPAPKPSKPSERVPAVPGEPPSPKPSRPTGELPAVPAPKPSKPSERVPAVPAPAPSPSRLPPADPDFLTLHASPAPGAGPSPKPSKPSERVPAVPAPAPSPSRPPPADPDFLTLHASPAPGAGPSPKPSRPTGELPAVPAPKPSKPSERVPAVPAPAPSPSRPPPADPDFLALHASPAPGAGPSPKPSKPTGELPAVPAPKPSKPSERVPAVPAPAPSPSRPPPADPDFLTLHASPPPVAGVPAPAPSTPTDAPSPAREVPFSTPSQMLSHDEDPFRLYERGAVMTADVPHADVALPRPSTPSIIIDEDAGPAAAPSSAPPESAPAPPESAPAQPAPPESAPAQPAPPESAPAKAPFTSSPSLEQFLAENAVPEARTYDDAAVDAAAVDAAAVDAAALGLARKRPRWLLPALVGVAVLALVGAGAWLLRPVPRQFTAPAKLTAVAAQPVTAPRAGDVGPHAVEDGAMVKAGQPLGALDDTAAKKRLAGIEKRRAAIDRRRAALVPAADKKVKPAAKKAELARKVYAAAATKLERAEALPPAKRRAAVAKAKKAEAAAKTKLKKAEAALEALTHEGELRKLADESAALETEAAALGEALATPPFTAPIAGRLTWLKAAGDAVQPGDVVAQVDPGQWKVHADVHVTLPPGIPVEATVAVGGAALELRKLQVTDAAVDGVVESPKPLAATGTVELSAGERHAWELLVGSD